MIHLVFCLVEHMLLVMDSKLTGETINDGSRAASAKLVSASRTVGHGVKATGETLAEGSKVAGKKMKVVPGKIGAGLKAGGSEVKEGTVAVGLQNEKRN